MKLVDLRSCDNYVSANIIRLKLEAHGLHCFLNNENITTLYGGAFTKIILRVPEEELATAEKILLDDEIDAALEQSTLGFWENDTAQLDPDNRVCIYCGSKNTRRVEDKKDSFILSWLFDRLKINYQSEKWHCFHCGKTF